MQKTKSKTNIKKKLKQPSEYDVLFHNDDVTPAMLVIMLLVTVFELSEEQAIQMTLSIEKSMVVGTYIKPIAKTLKNAALSKCDGYPLKITLKENK